MANRFAESGKLPEEKSKDLFETLTAIWDKFLMNVAGGGGITKEMFIETMKKAVRDPNLKSAVEGPLPLFFHAVDSNSDGFISEEEYGEFFKILGMDPNLAPASFKAIDTNNDGLLSEDEFRVSGTDFFLSEDQNCPTKYFWGPLV